MRTPTAEWDERFMALAQQVATWSKDPSCKVGAVVVSPDRRRFGVGYNGFPQGVHDAAYRLDDTGVRVDLTVHAEVNAVLNAGVAVRGWALYSTKAPCLECAKVIIQAGAARVVAPLMDTESKWFKSCALAVKYMHEAGVAVEFIKQQGRRT